jgi:hypothetical protein
MNMSASVKTQFDAQKVMKAAQKANITSLGHAGAAIRLTARRSIRRSPNPSLPGKPPHTRRGRLRNAIVYALSGDKQSVVVGPAYGVVRDVGMAHEFGGRYKGDVYKPRPFMGLAIASSRIACRDNGPIRFSKEKRSWVSNLD